MEIAKGGKIRTPKPKKTQTYTKRKKAPAKNVAKGKTANMPRKENLPDMVGYVFWGKTKYIDREIKEKRRYVVTRQGKKGSVTVSKVQSIKLFDENGKNADKNLVEINQNYPGLSKRSGVDKWRYDTNLMSNKPLQIQDKDVFEQEPAFKLGTRDMHRVWIHTGIKRYCNKKSKP